MFTYVRIPPEPSGLGEYSASCIKFFSLLHAKKREKSNKPEKIGRFERRRVLASGVYYLASRFLLFFGITWRRTLLPAPERCNSSRVIQDLYL